jgi:hypothetical protein
VAATFAHRTRQHSSPRAITDLTDHPTETGSKPDDIVSVTSVVADNLQSPKRSVSPGSSRAMAISKRDSRQASDLHMASTPTKTNVVFDASVILPRGRDPSILLATPDLEQPLSMSSAQYKKRHSADGSSRRGASPQKYTEGGSPRKVAGSLPTARAPSSPKRDPPAWTRESTHIEL